MHDAAYTKERADALWKRLVSHFEERGIDCGSCRALAREYVERTDIYGAGDTWQTATRIKNNLIEMDGIIHTPGPFFMSVFCKKDFGYAADEKGTCRRCRRTWHYRADYHFGMFAGCLTLHT